MDYAALGIVREGILMRLEVEHGVLGFDQVDGVKMRGTYAFGVLLTFGLLGTFWLGGVVGATFIWIGILAAIGFAVARLQNVFVVIVLKDGKWHKLKPMTYPKAKNLEERIKTEILA